MTLRTPDATHSNRPARLRWCGSPARSLVTIGDADGPTDTAQEELEAWLCESGTRLDVLVDALASGGRRGLAPRLHGAVDDRRRPQPQVRRDAVATTGTVTIGPHLPTGMTS